MDEKLYEFHELIAGALALGVIAETVNLGELNYKIWFNPKTFKLEYKDYPDQPVEIICEGHEFFGDTITENGKPVMFKIINN